jgi:hypothetical protein
VNYAELLEMNSFLTWHIFLEVGKIKDLSGQIWQSHGDALIDQSFPTSPIQLSAEQRRQRPSPSAAP